MMPGRFFLGVGSGENLNEHVLGDRWPLPDERLEMLEEAVEVIRLLWQGGEQTPSRQALHRRPRAPIHAAREASRSTSRQRSRTPQSSRAASATASSRPRRTQEFVKAFDDAGGSGKQKLGMMHCAYDKDEKKGLDARDEALAEPRAEGAARQELATPSDFEEAAAMVDEDDVTE